MLSCTAVTNHGATMELCWRSKRQSGMLWPYKMTANYCFIREFIKQVQHTVRWSSYWRAPMPLPLKSSSPRRDQQYREIQTVCWWRAKAGPWHKFLQPVPFYSMSTNQLLHLDPDLLQPVPFQKLMSMNQLHYLEPDLLNKLQQLTNGVALDDLSNSTKRQASFPGNSPQNHGKVQSIGGQSR